MEYFRQIIEACTAYEYRHSAKEAGEHAVAHVKDLYIDASDNTCLINSNSNKDTDKEQHYFLPFSVVVENDGRDVDSLKRRVATCASNSNSSSNFQLWRIVFLKPNLENLIICSEIVLTSKNKNPFYICWNRHDTNDVALKSWELLGEFEDTQGFNLVVNQ